MQALAGSARQTWRSLSSLPAEVVETGTGEFVSLTPGAPVLVRLHERTWGALAKLPSSKLAEAGFTGRQMPEEIAVVRDAFAPHDVPHRTLAGSVHSLGPHKVAVASELAEPHNRMVVDEYELSPDGRYHLRSIGTDMHRFLRRHGMHVVHVPDVQAAVASAARGLNSLRSHHTLKQSTNEVLMVAPTAFVFNEQAAQDNTFMHGQTGAGNSVTAAVLREFAALHHELSEVAGVKVNLFQHSLEHGTPDAVFPNNWFSTHPVGEASGGVKKDTLVFYPMKCPNRQAERRQDIREVLEHWGYDRVVDLSGEERQGRYFEGTGVLVVDRINGVAYVALSERADVALAQRWVEEMGYRDLVTFRSTDGHGGAVYHTNVMMAVGTDVAVVCLESIDDDKERRHLVDRLSKTHTIVDITRQQMAALCGNVLELEDGRGLPVLAMSTQAYNAFTEDQRKLMRKHVAALHHAPIDTLERIGGGGVRCTLAEIF